MNQYPIWVRELGFQVNRANATPCKGRGKKKEKLSPLGLSIRV